MYIYISTIPINMTKKYRDTNQKCLFIKSKNLSYLPMDFLALCIISNNLIKKTITNNNAFIAFPIYTPNILTREIYISVKGI